MRSHQDTWGNDLQFTNYDLQFGGGVVTKARRHEDDLQFTNYDLQFGGGVATKARRHEGEDEVRMKSRRSNTNLHSKD